MKQIQISTLVLLLFVPGCKKSPHTLYFDPSFKHDGQLPYRVKHWYVADTIYLEDPLEVKYRTREGRLLWLVVERGTVMESIKKNSDLETEWGAFLSPTNTMAYFPKKETAPESIPQYCFGDRHILMEKGRFMVYEYEKPVHKFQLLLVNIDYFNAVESTFDAEGVFLNTPLYKLAYCKVAIPLCD